MKELITKYNEKFEKINTLLKVVYILFFMTLTGFVFSVALDFWWHLKSGLWMLEHGKLLYRDIFSFTMNGELYRNGYIIYQLTMAVWYKFFGGLKYMQVLFAIIYFITGFFLTLHLYKNKNYLKWINILPIILFTFIGCLQESLRPIAFSSLYLSIYLYFAHKIYINRKINIKEMLIFSTTMIMWVYTHNYILGLIVFFSLTCDFLIDTLTKKQNFHETKKIAIFGLFLVLLTFATPLFKDANIFTIFNHGNSYSSYTVDEYSNFISMGFQEISVRYPVVIYLFAFSILLCIYIYKKRIINYPTILSCLYLFITIKYIRFTWQFLLVSFFIVPIFLQVIQANHKDKKFYYSIVSLLIFIILYGTLKVIPMRITNRITYKNQRMPFEISSFIKDNNLKGNFLCDYASNDLLVFNNSDQGIKVGFDGRVNVVYPEYLSWSLVNSWFNPSIMEHWLNNYEINYIITNKVPDKPNGINFLTDKGWKVIYLSPTHLLMTHETNPIFKDQKPITSITPFFEFSFSKLIDELKEKGKLYDTMLQIIENQNERYTGKLLLGLKYIVDDKESEAIKIWQKLLDEEPRIKSLPAFYLSSYYMEKGNYCAAEKIMENFNIFDFKPNRYYYLMGQIYNNAGHYNKTKKLYDKFNKEKKGLPVDNEYLSLLADAEFNLENYTNAIFYYQCLEKLDSKNPEVLFNLAISYQNIFDIENSIKYLQKALELKNAFRYKLELLRSYLLIKDKDNAQKILDLINSDFNNPDLSIEIKNQYQSSLQPFLEFFNELK